MSRLLDNLLIFARVLRRAGVPVDSGRVAELVEALTYVDLAAREDVYQACRSLLIRGHEQMALFDLAFALFWRDHRDRHSAAEAGTARPPDPRRSLVDTQGVLAADALDSAAGS